MASWKHINDTWLNMDYVIKIHASEDIKGQYLHFYIPNTNKLVVQMTWAELYNTPSYSNPQDDT